METKEKRSERIIKTFCKVGLCGQVMLLISIIMILIKGSENQFWTTAVNISALIFMLPVFIAILPYTANLLDFADIKQSARTWINLLFYGIVFPFATMWIIWFLNSLFNFLPDFWEAINIGASNEIIQTLDKLYQFQSFAIMIISYLAMIFSGLIIRALQHK
ncbi:MAG: hypothetical protein PWQ35_583 [Patescibacteria group bacterium]|nr:hypothetical protein [Patescibacteria group bacterium]